LIIGWYPPISSIARAIQTVFDVIPHCCKVTAVPFPAVVAVPRQRAVGLPFGAYSYSYPKSDGQVVPTAAPTMPSA
jgi:hypothetical protein